MEKKIKIRLYSLMAIAILMVIGIMAYTYAYFSATVTKNNETQTIIKSNTLGLIYTGVTDINITDIIPGDYMNKTFTVENTSNRAVDYNIYMEDVLNEFNADLVYTLKDQDGTVIEEGPLPTTASGKTYIKTKVSIDTGETKSYTLTIKFKYSATESQNTLKGASFNATLGIDTEIVEKSLSAPWSIVNDLNSNDKPDVGDEIAIGLEHFYVISNIDGTVSALAKYNLNVGDNLNSNEPIGIQGETVKGWVQDGTKYGDVVFSTMDSWPYNYGEINVREVDGPVKDALYGENGYEQYIQKQIPGATMRLLLKPEIETLLYDGNTISYTDISSAADEKGYSWLYSTSYYTGWAYWTIDRDCVYTVSSSGNTNDMYYKYGSSGVRPVVVFNEN